MSIVNAELTAEKTGLCASYLTFSIEGERRATHEDERRVQVLVVLSRIISVKLPRLPAV